MRYAQDSAMTYPQYMPIPFMFYNVRHCYILILATWFMNNMNHYVLINADMIAVALKVIPIVAIICALSTSIISLPNLQIPFN